MRKLLLMLMAMIFTVVTASADYYLIGAGVNGKYWSLAQSDCKFTETSSGVYEWTGTSLLSNFKINDGTWNNNNANFGSNGSTLSLGTPYKYSIGGSTGDIAFESGVSEVENPKVVLNTNDQTITVTGKDSYVAPVLYLRGEMNDWNISEAYKFNTTDDNIYTYTSELIEAGKGFKIGSDGWTTSLTANNLSMTNGDYPLDSGGENNNMAFASPMKNVTLTLNLSAMTLNVNGTPDGDYVPDYSSWYVNVVGPFNEWADNGQNPNGENIATVENLAIGTQGFKVKVWNNVDAIYYVSDGSAVPLNTWTQLYRDAYNGSPTQIEGATESSFYNVQYNVVTNQVYVSLVETDTRPQSLYLIGTVNGEGWNPTKGVAMDDEGDGFFKAENVTFAEVEGSAGFAFVTDLAEYNDQGGWDYINARRYGPLSNNEKIELTSGEAESEFAKNANSWQIDPGTYTIYFDYDGNTVTVEAAEVEEQKETVKFIFAGSDDAYKNLQFAACTISEFFDENYDMQPIDLTSNEYELTLGEMVNPNFPLSVAIVHPNEGYSATISCTVDAWKDGDPQPPTTWSEFQIGMAVPGQTSLGLYSGMKGQTFTITLEKDAEPLGQPEITPEKDTFSGFTPDFIASWKDVQWADLAEDSSRVLSDTEMKQVKLYINGTLNTAWYTWMGASVTIANTKGTNNQGAEGDTDTDNGEGDWPVANIIISLGDLSTWNIHDNDVIRIVIPEGLVSTTAGQRIPEVEMTFTKVPLSVDAPTFTPESGTEFTDEVPNFTIKIDSKFGMNTNFWSMDPTITYTVNGGSAQNLTNGDVENLVPFPMISDDWGSEVKITLGTLPETPGTYSYVVTIPKEIQIMNADAEEAQLPQTYTLNYTLTVSDNSEPVDFEAYTLVPASGSTVEQFDQIVFTWDNPTYKVAVEKKAEDTDEYGNPYIYIIGISDMMSEANGAFTVTAQDNKLIINFTRPVVNPNPGEVWPSLFVQPGAFSINGQVFDSEYGLSANWTMTPSENAEIIPEPVFSPAKGLKAAATISEITANWEGYYVSYADDTSWSELSSAIKIYKEDIDAITYKYDNPINVTVKGTGDSFMGFPRWYTNLTITPQETLSDPNVKYVLVIPNYTLAFKNISTENNIDVYSGGSIEAIWTVVGEGAVSVSPRQFQNIAWSEWNGLTIENATKNGISVADAAKVKLYAAYLASETQMKEMTPVATGTVGTAADGSIQIDFDAELYSGAYTLIVENGAFNGLADYEASHYKTASERPFTMEGFTKPTSGAIVYGGIRFTIEGNALPYSAIEVVADQDESTVEAIEDVQISWSFNGNEYIPIALPGEATEPGEGLLSLDNAVSTGKTVPGYYTVDGGEQVSINWTISRQAINPDEAAEGYNYALIYTPEAPLTKKGEYVFTLPANSVTLYANGQNAAVLQDVEETVTITVEPPTGGKLIFDEEPLEVTFYTNNKGTTDAPVKASVSTELSLELDGDAFNYKGYQFRIQLPEFVELTGVTSTLDGADANFSHPTGKNYYNVVVTNNTTDAVEGLGTLNFEVTYTGTTLAPLTEGVYTYDFVIDDASVIFSTPKGQDIESINGYTGQLTVNIVTPKTPIEEVTVTEAEFTEETGSFIEGGFNLSSDEATPNDVTLDESITVGENLDLTVELGPEDAEGTVDWKSNVDGVTVVENEDGTYTVNTEGIEGLQPGEEKEVTITATVTNEEGEEEEVGSFTFTVRGLFLGDSNDNQKVTVADVVTTANVIAGTITDTPFAEVVRFDFPNANVILQSEEGSPEVINVQDLNATVNIVLETFDGIRKPTNVRRYARSLASNDRLCAENFKVAKNAPFTIGVTLENSYAYSSIEAVVTLPEGMSLVEAKAGPRAAGHEFVCRTNGRDLKVVIYSKDNAPFAAGEGALFELVVTADSNCGNLEIGNILASDSAANGYRLDFQGGLNDTFTTGVGSLDVEEEGVRYFTVDGIEVLNPEKGQILIRVNGSNVEKVVVK